MSGISFGSTSLSRSRTADQSVSRAASYVPQPRPRTMPLPTAQSMPQTLGSVDTPASNALPGATGRSAAAVKLPMFDSDDDSEAAAPITAPTAGLAGLLPKSAAIGAARVDTGDATAADRAQHNEHSATLAPATAARAMSVGLAAPADLQPASVASTPAKAQPAATPTDAQPHSSSRRAPPAPVAPEADALSSDDELGFSSSYVPSFASRARPAQATVQPRTAARKPAIAEKPVATVKPNIQPALQQVTRRVPSFVAAPQTEQGLCSAGQLHATTPVPATPTRHAPEPADSGFGLSEDMFGPPAATQPPAQPPAAAATSTDGLVAELQITGTPRAHAGNTEAAVKKASAGRTGAALTSLGASQRAEHSAFSGMPTDDAQQRTAAANLSSIVPSAAPLAPPSAAQPQSLPATSSLRRIETPADQLRQRDATIATLKEELAAARAATAAAEAATHAKVTEAACEAAAQSHAQIASLEEQIAAAGARAAKARGEADEREGKLQVRHDRAHMLMVAVECSQTVRHCTTSRAARNRVQYTWQHVAVSFQGHSAKQEGGETCSGAAT